MRLLFRLVGLLLLGAAFAAMIIDGTRSIAAGTVSILPLGQTLDAISADGWTKAETYLKTKLPALWDPLLVTLLQWPVWLVLGVLGLVLMILTRRRTPKIGHSRR